MRHIGIVDHFLVVLDRSDFPKKEKGKIRFQVN